MSVYTRLAVFVDPEDRSGVKSAINNLIADQYDTIGREATTALFESGPHTNRKGAEFTAKVIADALKAAPDDPLAKFLRDKPAANW